MIKAAGLAMVLAGVIGASPAYAGDARLVLGAVIGGGAGAAIGQSLGGRDAAIIGSAIGAAAGAAVVATQPRAAAHPSSGHGATHSVPIHGWPGAYGGVVVYPPVVQHPVPSFQWGSPTVIVQIGPSHADRGHAVPPGHAFGHPGRGHRHGYRPEHRHGDSPDHRHERRDGRHASRW